MDLSTALDSLDPTNDAHWTDNGLPRLSALRDMTGLESVKRAEVTGLRPSLTRDAAGSAEPAPEPAPAAQGQDVLKLPVNVVAGDYKLCLEARDALIEQAAELQCERAQVQLRLDSNAAQVEAVERMIVRHERAQPKASSDPGIRAYLDRQQKVREERADRRRAFLEAGTTAQDVAQELRGSSPLDAALGARPKATRGRPEPRIPAHRRAQ